LPRVGFRYVIPIQKEEAEEEGEQQESTPRRRNISP